MPLEPRPPTPAEQIASRRRHAIQDHLAEIGRKVDAGEPVGSVDLEWCSRCARDRHDKCVDRGYWTERSSDDEHRCRCDCWLPNDELDPTPNDELDEWRRTYGRLDKVNDYPIRLIDWRPVYAGLAALVAVALVARRIVRGTAQSTPTRR